MRFLLVGLGNIGARRRALLGTRCVGTVDLYNREADCRTPEECPPERYDAAVLAVPNAPKLALLEQFLALGKHVLVEKPLLLPSRFEAERLDALARRHGATWYTSYNHRFEPLIVALRDLLRSEAIGPLYHGRFFYGNGTVAHVANSWRDEGLGVVEDLGSHLLDLLRFLLPEPPETVVPWARERHEARAYDHAVAASTDGRWALEMSYLSWKNTFTIDLFGRLGSLHLHGLPKWGPSELVLRRRVFPSGVPQESRQTAAGPDLTWQRDLEHFESLAGRGAAPGATSMENDWWISQCLRNLA